MNQNLSKTKKDWETLAKEDPLWAILGADDKKYNSWKLNEFFKTGQEEINLVIKYLKEKKLLPKAKKSSLDFGCGVGRLTRALSKYFDESYGVDISPTMIKSAKDLNKEFKNCKFLETKGKVKLDFPDN